MAPPLAAARRHWHHLIHRLMGGWRLVLQGVGSAHAQNVPAWVAQAELLQDLGVRHADLNPVQQAQLMQLIESFTRLLEPALAEQHLQRVQDAPQDNIRFGWIGGLNPQEGNYLQGQGPRFLFKYNNAGSHHVHSIWGDFDGDWDRTRLAEHYHQQRRCGSVHLHRNGKLFQ